MKLDTQSYVAGAVVTGAVLAFLILIIGLMIIAVRDDSRVLDSLIAAFTTLMGALAGSLGLILQHYLTNNKGGNNGTPTS